MLILKMLRPNQHFSVTMSIRQNNWIASFSIQPPSLKTSFKYRNDFKGIRQPSLPHYRIQQFVNC